jgi:hypothetical protein
MSLRALAQLELNVTIPDHGPAFHDRGFLYFVQGQHALFCSGLMHSFNYRFEKVNFQL